MAIEKENKERVELLIQQEAQKFHTSIPVITWLDTEAGPDIRLQIRFGDRIKLLTLEPGNIEYCVVEGWHKDLTRRAIIEMLKRP